MHLTLVNRLSCSSPCGLAAFALVLGACALPEGAGTSSVQENTGLPESGLSAPTQPDGAAHSPAVVERPEICARELQDPVRDVFCAEAPPRVDSLATLQQVLHVVPNEFDERLIEAGSVTMLAHSTALAGHKVSTINPRVIILTREIIMAFQRGLQQVEVIALARNPGLYNFYLFRFQQSCNQRSSGCTPGDLYTERLERDWLSVTVQDGEALKNTPDDCRQCHQRARPAPQLLMRELENPWTHFLQPITGADPGPGVQGEHLMQDYLNAKGDEIYAGFAVDRLLGVAPFVLQRAVRPDQPVLFDAPGIESECFPYQPDVGYPASPMPSATWQAAFKAFQEGEQLALPYVEARVTDPAKLAQLTAAYARYREGAISADALPDLSDIFPDDPGVRAQIGLQTVPDASAQDALIQACGTCHNNVLDQGISRARFNIDLWQLDAAEIETAIERISRTPDQPGVMPPAGTRQLDIGARARLLDYLRADPLAQSPDIRLQKAAELGMTGGRERRATRH